MKRKMLLLTLALPVVLFQNAQAQTKSRLIGDAQWSNNGVVFTPVDSDSYMYSNNRGGSLELNPTTSMDAATINAPAPLKYDNSTNYSFVGDSAYTAWYYVQTFDANNNVTSVIAQHYNTGTASYELYSNTLYTYNASNMLTSSILQYWNSTTGMWIPSSQQVYNYNAAGKLSSQVSNNWNTLTSAFDANSQRTFYYDVSGNQIDETDQQWVSGSPVYSNQFVRTYSSTNQLLTTTFKMFDGTNWVNQYMFTHAYDTMTNPISVLYQTYNSTTSAWVNSDLDLFSNFNGSHLPMSGLRQTWDTTSPGLWVNADQDTYTYNTFNQLTMSNSESWNIVGMFEYAAGDPQRNYYYESYDSSTTTVAHVANTADVANVYPVPAQNVLHIDINWSAAQSATITIVDVTGKTVSAVTTPSGVASTSILSVSALPTGTYFVKINGQKAQIVKQIVVAH